MSASGITLYDQLGVGHDVDASELRAAYRMKAKQHHPDRVLGLSGTPNQMAALNEAWSVLSNPSTRAAYDRTLDPIEHPTSAISGLTTTVYVPDEPRFPRREAWMAGLRVQIVRHAREAVNSASWALSLKRHGRPRDVYLAKLDEVIHYLLIDTSDRMKVARAAGAAPLDLALATTLVGIDALATKTLEDCRVAGPSVRHEVLAELIDRSWDNLAHGISHEVEQNLGGNPHLVRQLARR